MKGILSALLILSLMGSCKLFDREEPVPAYLCVRNPKVLFDSIRHYEAEYGAKDYWIYKGPEIVGVYPFGTAIPITDLSPGQYTIEAGVFESGVSAYRVPYPFWIPQTFTVTPEALDTFVFEPTFRYYSDSFINFNLEENFENPSFGFYPISSVDTVNLVRSTTSPFFGNSCAVAQFDSTHQILDIASDFMPYLSKGTDTYAEITFRSDFNLQVGLFYLSPQQRRVSDVALLPKQTWTTVFIHLTKLIKDAPADPNLRFRLWIYAYGGGATGSVSLDEIRLVHFK